MSDSDWQQERIVFSAPNLKGWRELTTQPAEPRQGMSPGPDPEPLLTLLHISDLHLCDAQSPARVEYLDRFADPHHPLSEIVGYVGTYRAQEMLTMQTLEALVRRLNSIQTGVESDRPIDAVVITGDVTDNAQSNELNWYLQILHGGKVTPDSGDPSKWEGAASTDPDKYDPSYWNPEGTPAGCVDDYPRSLYGFPTIPGLSDVVRQSFSAEGLRHRWLSTHGNHDALLQGTVPADEMLREFVVGSKKVKELATAADIQQLLGEFQMVGPVGYPTVDGSTFTPVVADSNRQFNKSTDWSELHLKCGHDHGFSSEEGTAKRKYWIRNINNIALISLDTVNENGGWQGSLDREQFIWLREQLETTSAQYCVILSHHPAHTLFNGYAQPGAQERVLEKEVVELLLRYPKVILWLAGHNHLNNIEFIGESSRKGFWHIQTASNIDWPQQGRVVEILKDNDQVVISTSVFDHAGLVNPELVAKTDPLHLAGLSRLLAGNDWQRRSGQNDVELLAGAPGDRNRHLRLHR